MSTVLLDRAEGVVTLTLNRPERRNGITRELVDEAIAALHAVAADHRDRVLVLTGAAGAFCSGMDLAEPLSPDPLTFMRRVGEFCRVLHELPIPTIAKVRGGAIGFGANLALCADLVLAAEDAVFGEVFAARGIGLDGAGSWTLPRLIGPQKAKELAFFGAKVTGAQAHELGLINRAVPDAELDKLVEDWATRLAAGPRRALSVIKAELNQSYERSFAAAIEVEAIAQAQAFSSPEAKEGVQAFLQKREPDFRAAEQN
ncbi:MAG TPA: enoyl-CoA hydratase-related protein [Sporichthyaceae bacterium]|nr:enoyl-CoA hydratase-related protein [Sporichthyaceae bacterium]